MSVDLSGLDQFKASDLLEPFETKANQPAELPLDVIDFDPAQPRRSLDEAKLKALAASIGVHGVLEPVSLRPSSVPGRYIVNRGERRVRASRLAGRLTIPWFLDERVDPFIQAAENLQREDLSPFDLALFIAEREREGHSRSEIARRLHTSPSFITEVAALADAPAEVRSLYESGRTKDTRVLYEMVKAVKEAPETASQLTEGEGALSRKDVKAARQSTAGSPTAENGRRVEFNRPARALLVEHGGRRGRLRLRGYSGQRSGSVAFEDGTELSVELGELKLVAWTAR